MSSPVDLPKYHRHDWPTLIAELEKTGQSPAAFCRERGLRGSSLSKALKRMQVGKVAGFVRVEVAGLHKAPAPCVIEFASGARVVLPEVDPLAIVRELARLK